MSHCLEVFYYIMVVLPRYFNQSIFYICVPSLARLIGTVLAKFEV